MEIDVVGEHAARIKQLLDQPNVNQTPRRLFRTRYRVAGEFVVASVLQGFPRTSAESMSVSIFVIRGFQRAELHLTGKYSVDEIVAFLALSIVDPETVRWVDETPTNIVVPSTVPAILEKFNS